MIKKKKKNKTKNTNKIKATEQCDERQELLNVAAGRDCSDSTVRGGATNTRLTARHRKVLLVPATTFCGEPPSRTCLPPAGASLDRRRTAPPTERAAASQLASQPESSSNTPTTSLRLHRKQEVPPNTLEKKKMSKKKIQ